TPTSNRFPIRDINTPVEHVRICRDPPTLYLRQPCLWTQAHGLGCSTALATRAGGPISGSSSKLQARSVSPAYPSHNTVQGAKTPKDPHPETSRRILRRVPPQDDSSFRNFSYPVLLTGTRAPSFRIAMRLSFAYGSTRARLSTFTM